MRFVRLQHIENIVRRYCGATESLAIHEAIHSAPEYIIKIEGLVMANGIDKTEGDAGNTVDDLRAENARLLKRIAGQSSDLARLHDENRKLKTERVSLNERLEKQRVEIVRFQKGLRELLDEAP